MTNNDPIVIQPRQAPISGSGVGEAAQAAPSEQRTTAQKLLIGVGALAMAAMLVWVFFVLPDSIAQKTTPSIATQTPAPSSPADKATSADDSTSIANTPFQDLQLERAKEKASEQLAEFVELQIKLEDEMQVTQWGEVEYGEIKDLATAGDELFTTREFENALSTYGEATDRLKSLRDQGDELFTTALAAGLAALENFDQPLAEQEFAKALEIRPNDADANAGQVRTTNLPELQRLLRRARQLQRRGDIDAAYSAYQDVLALDALTPGINTALNELGAARKQNQFEDELSKGFAALDKGQHKRARTAFNAALALRPSDPVAKGGLQQIAQETEINSLQRLRNEAAQAAQTEDWKSALANYENALKIDGNLEFAVKGRREAKERVRFLSAMRRIQTNPTRLSDDKSLAQADDLMKSAAALASSGPKWDEQIEVTQALLQSYRKPVAVTLTSDNETVVTVYKVGRLGAFDSHELQLRPGAYTIVGSQDGCQDVRKEVIVKPAMPPIEISCEVKL